MAREYEFHGLDQNTRRKMSNRPFEDLRGKKTIIPAYHQTEGLIVSVEESAAGRPVQKIKLTEEPPTKARLTIREKKRKFSKTGVSLADE